MVLSAWTPVTPSFSPVTSVSGGVAPLHSVGHPAEAEDLLLTLAVHVHGAGLTFHPLPGQAVQQ